MPTMDETEVLEALLDDGHGDVSPRFARAAALLDKAVRGGCEDVAVLNLLAIAYRRQGKIAEARETLRKIARPDADALLQIALLSLEENQVARAEGELTAAWQMDPSSYEACYNLILTRLTLGQI